MQHRCERNQMHKLSALKYIYFLQTRRKIELNVVRKDSKNRLKKDPQIFVLAKVVIKQKILAR